MLLIALEVLISVVLTNADTKDEMEDGKIELLSNMAGVAATPVVETPVDTPTGEFSAPDLPYSSAPDLSYSSSP